MRFYTHENKLFFTGKKNRIISELQRNGVICKLHCTKCKVVIVLFCSQKMRIDSQMSNSIEVTSKFLACRNWPRCFTSLNPSHYVKKESYWRCFSVICHIVSWSVGFWVSLPCFTIETLKYLHTKCNIVVLYQQFHSATDQNVKNKI